MDEFENVGENEEREPNADVHHYHAHDEHCGDMGHSLHKMEKSEAKPMGEVNEHTELGNIKDREELNPAVHKGEYPGIIRKLR